MPERSSGSPEQRIRILTAALWSVLALASLLCLVGAVRAMGERGRASGWQALALLAAELASLGFAASFASCAAGREMDRRKGADPLPAGLCCAVSGLACAAYVAVNWSVLDRYAGGWSGQSAAALTLKGSVPLYLGAYACLLTAAVRALSAARAARMRLAPEPVGVRTNDERKDPMKEDLSVPRASRARLPLADLASIVEETTQGAGGGMVARFQQRKRTRTAQEIAAELALRLDARDRIARRLAESVRAEEELRDAMHRASVADEARRVQLDSARAWEARDVPAPAPPAPQLPRHPQPGPAIAPAPPPAPVSADDPFRAARERLLQDAADLIERGADAREWDEWARRATGSLPPNMASAVVRIAEEERRQSAP